ncbi:hypothetical protein D7W79_07130 [Corallococcus exercitus]|uniref:hypothetical protein n=1 Tax=Corallococcus exercitus TaxID=2316736 RepID=UPI000EA1DE8F|nr:hypothetical protein [Corallococcus exercitus]RKG80721.1 hypothetical protein D7W79_07130 [Corallococcus exercitus]
MLLQIIVFLLFIGAEKLVNRSAKRPLMNGAGWYLVVASIMFVMGFVHINSVVATGDMGMHAELLGRLIGIFIFPVGTAIHYARKFSRERVAAASEEFTASP